MITSVLPYLQVLLAGMNICVLVYAFVKFLNKPHSTLEDRVNAHDVEIRENTRIEPTFSGFLLLCGLCSNASANGIGSRVRKLGLKVLFATNEQYN